MRNKSILLGFIFALLLASCSSNKKNEKPPMVREVVSYFSDSTTERVVWEHPQGSDSVILVSHFYKNKQLQMQGNIVGGVRNGEWNAWDDQGQKLSTGHYVDGIENGLWTVWFPNGQKRYEGIFKDGKRVGIWSFYNKKGEKVKEIKY